MDYRVKIYKKIKKKKHMLLVFKRRGHQQKPVGAQEKSQGSSEYVPVLETLIQHGTANLGREQKKNQFQTHEQAPMSGLSAQTHT